MSIIGSRPRDVAENPGSISITTASIAAATRVAVVHVEGDLRFHIGRTFQNIVTITFFGGQEHERANCEGSLHEDVDRGMTPDGARNTESLFRASLEPLRLPTA